MEDKIICGIIGVASTEGMKNRASRLQFMKMGLDIDSWRGWESTGLALVPTASKDAPIVYKRALNGRDFIQLNKVDKYLDDIEKYDVALGHNRAATTGRGNIVDHNAHPFQYGKITLVHNGHIRNTNELKGAQIGAQCQVDSAHVAWAMNENGEKETLEAVEGGFVFVWWNSETSLLNIARNTERPLHMAFAEKENTFYWASELTELLHLLKDTKIDEDIGILYPKAMNWYQFNLKDLREFTKVPFAQSQGRQSHTHNTQHGTQALTGNEGQGWDELDRYEEELWRMRTDHGTEASEVDEIRQSVSNQRLKDAKISGVPTSKKRTYRAIMELKKLGIEYNSLRNCRPVSWCKYKNQMNLGSVLARTIREGYLIEVLQVRHDDWLEYKKFNTIMVDCVNVKAISNNDTRVIGIVSPRMKEYLDRKKAVQAEVEKAVDSTNRIYDGPSGKKVTLARFIELTDKGCGNCQCDIDSSMHGAITWVYGDCPLCPECAGDSTVLELLGVPSETRITGNIH